MVVSETFRDVTTGPEEYGMDSRTSRLRSHCICRTCPTYNECMREKEELLFCIGGKSPACMFEKKGCLCPACPVTTEFRFLKSYDCIRGSEEEQLKNA